MTKEQKLDMENKLNQEALGQYSKEYSSIVSDKMYAKTNAVSGKDIVENIPVKQVGLFILFELFRKWKHETEQLKSPYFNYDEPEVKQKLKELLNILSKNILIPEEHFTPLLSQAVEKTLLLILSPLRYYEELIDSFGGTAPNMEEVSELQKFVKINSHMRDALLSAWASNSDEENILDKAFEGLSEPPEDVSTLLAPFNEILPIDADAFWNEDRQEASGNLLIDEDDPDPDFETVHAQFSSENTTLLVDTLGFETNQVSLKNMLTINQKFMFVNDLFNGNKDDFAKVIDFLDTCETKEVVSKFLNSNYISRGEWKVEAPQVKEFLRLIDKKFS